MCCRVSWTRAVCQADTTYDTIRFLCGFSCQLFSLALSDWLKMLMKRTFTSIRTRLAYC